jgi:hypothetical protein
MIMIDNDDQEARAAGEIGVAIGAVRQWGVRR